MPQVPDRNECIIVAIFVAECAMNEMGSDAFKRMRFKNQKESILEIPDPSISADLLVVCFGFL